MSEINPGPALTTPRDSSEPDTELRALYEQLDSEVARLGPICELSGRCCRFQEIGHTLFVSSLEVQFLLDHAPDPDARSIKGGLAPGKTLGTVARHAVRVHSDVESISVTPPISSGEDCRNSSSPGSSD